MWWLKHKFVKICAIVIFVASCTHCLHLVPVPSYPCCGNLAPSPDLGRVIYSPAYNPLTLGSENDAFTSGQKTYSPIMPPPFVPDDDTSAGYHTKAFSCSLIPCLDEETATSVCACNFKTGNVVTFKDSCDVKKHNCRFDTSFKVILNEICPWEFESRRSNNQFVVDYNDPKYYNR